MKTSTPSLTSKIPDSQTSWAGDIQPVHYLKCFSCLMGMHCLLTLNAGAVCYIRLSPVNTHLFDSVGIWGEGLVLIARNSKAFSKSGHEETEWFLASTERMLDKCKGLLWAIRAKGCDDVQLLHRITMA